MNSPWTHWVFWSLPPVFVHLQELLGVLDLVKGECPIGPIALNPNSQEVVSVAEESDLEILSDVGLEFIGKSFVADRNKVVDVDGDNEGKSLPVKDLVNDIAVRVSSQLSHPKLG